MLCCACVHANPEEAAVHLVEPILSSLISSLKAAPNTGYAGTGTFHASTNKVVDPFQLLPLNY